MAISGSNVGIDIAGSWMISLHVSLDLEETTSLGRFSVLFLSTTAPDFVPWNVHDQFRMFSIEEIHYYLLIGVVNEKSAGYYIGLDGRV